MRSSICSMWSVHGPYIHLHSSISGDTLDLRPYHNYCDTKSIAEYNQHCLVALAPEAGLRIFYLDKDFNLRTHLLAVKLYRPAPELEKSVTGDIVMKWVKQVLRQFHLGNEDIAGAVTDARKDVRSGVGSTFEWEWCIPHLLNRVAADGSGMALTKKQSKNLECRALVEEMKRVHEDFNTSTASKVIARAKLELVVSFGVLDVLSTVVSVQYTSAAKVLLTVAGHVLYQALYCCWWP